MARARAVAGSLVATLSPSNAASTETWLGLELNQAVGSDWRVGIVHRLGITRHDDQPSEVYP